MCVSTTGTHVFGVRWMRARRCGIALHLFFSGGGHPFLMGLRGRRLSFFGHRVDRGGTDHTRVGEPMERCGGVEVEGGGGPYTHLCARFGLRFDTGTSFGSAEIKARTIDVASSLHATPQGWHVGGCECTHGARLSNERNIKVIFERHRFLLCIFLCQRRGDRGVCVCPSVPGRRLS